MTLSDEQRERALKLDLQLRFSERLNELLNAIPSIPRQGKGRIEAAARLLGTSVSTTHRMLTGSVLPEAHRLLWIAECLGVALDYLLGNVSANVSKMVVKSKHGEDCTIDDDHYVVVPILNPDKVLEGEANFYVPRRHLSRFIDEKETAVLIQMQGECMAPTLQHGELLMIGLEPLQESEDMLSDGLYPLCSRGGKTWTVRRLIPVLKGSYLITCDNAHYPAQQATHQALSEQGSYDWKIGGKVKTLLKRY